MNVHETKFAMMVQSDIDVLSEEDLQGTISLTVKDSDDNLRASAWFFGLDVIMLEERSAIFEFESNIPRVTANFLALRETLRKYNPLVTESLCKWFIRNASIVFEIANKHHLTVEQARSEVLAFVRRHNGNKSDVVKVLDELLERVL